MIPAPAGWPCATRPGTDRERLRRIERQMEAHPRVGGIGQAVVFLLSRRGIVAEGLHAEGQFGPAAQQFRDLLDEHQPARACHPQAVVCGRATQTMAHRAETGSSKGRLHFGKPSILDLQHHPNSGEQRLRRCCPSRRSQESPHRAPAISARATRSLRRTVMAGRSDRAPRDPAEP